MVDSVSGISYRLPELFLPSISNGYNKLIGLWKVLVCPSPEGTASIAARTLPSRPVISCCTLASLQNACSRLVFVQDHNITCVNSVLVIIAASSILLSM